MLYAVADVDGVERIRYTTSHPRDMGLDVIQAYRDIPTLCSYLHLPVQSGSSKILRRMKRFYTRERYLEVVAQLRDARPDLTLSTDFIVGFPGETAEDFEQTMSLLEEVRFHSSFSFKYSQRPDTPAIKLANRDPVDPVLAGKRLMRLQARQRQIAQEEHLLLEGTVLPVLVEGPSKHDEGVVCGRTSTFKTVNFPGRTSWVGQTIPVRITKAFANSLRGEVHS
ncbi:MAG: radical SAM protein [Myxococcota bacterium]|nr:radical SAM protein [Myxococcota bacterium]